jgi:hypothetical protein
MSTPGTAAAASNSVQTKELQAFFAYLPDKTDEGAYARRMSVRSDHFVRANRLKEAGIYRKLHLA